MANYAEALATAKKAGAEDVTDEGMIALLCDSPILNLTCGAVAGSLVYEGAIAKGLTYVEFARLASEDPDAIAALQWAHEAGPSASNSPETTTITATITLRIHPRAGQSPEGAAREAHALLREYLEAPGRTFRHEYGLTPEAAREFTAGAPGAAGPWGGYEGPFVTAVAVRDEDAVSARAEALVNLAGGDPDDPRQWGAALDQARAEWDGDREAVYGAR